LGPSKVNLSEQLKRDIGSDDPKEIFLGRISALSHRHKVHTLAFTGDLGYGDDLGAMEDGIDYIATLGERLKIPSGLVVVSPGNHDLDRKRAAGSEFDHLVEKCGEKGFAIADRERPARVAVNGIPILSVNTCLGGTEFAYYDLPEHFWRKLRKLLEGFESIDETLLFDMPEEIKSQLQTAMDIPAIGQRQCNEAEEYLSDGSGNFSVIIGHHNPLPTPRLVVRPFAEIIDVGRLIFNLLSNERRILFLHGHTHCDSALLTRSPDMADSGVMVCIGATGLHRMPGSTSSVSFIEVLADEKPDFLCAIVYRYLLKGSDFVQENPFILWDDMLRTSRSGLSIERLTAGKTFTVAEIASVLGRGYDDREELAVELLRHRVTHQIEIQDVSRPIEDWRISVNK
jgi:hypothetical protein